jgi:mono/diheme cytochrome c family protein
MMDCMARRIVCIIVLLSAVPLSYAQQQTKKIQKAPITQTSAASGEEMFKAYCSPCHGLSGKGNGPVASSLKVPPPDLTALALRNDGKFPDAFVGTVLRTGVGPKGESPAHGPADMPVWGPAFKAISGGSEALMDLRIANLIHYLESIQAR